MSTQSVYAYADIDRNTVMVDDGDIHYTGTWSSAGTYFAATKDAVLYGSTKYMTLVDNVGGVPTYIPRRGQAKWSSLVVIRQGTDATDHTVAEAYSLAENALAVAVAGTAAAAEAQTTANGASSIAVEALQTAWNGTVSYVEIDWSGTLEVDLAGETYQRLAIGGDTQINVVNPSPVRGVTAILVSGTDVTSLLTFTDDLIWFGQGAPTELLSGKRMIVNFTSFGSVASEIHAAYISQA